ncbi:MAG: oligosaccharide flippase family protein, partial [Ignavibacteriaceae bacterium]|nr:oligosaccharide flippase family protein [Ignavibacteriaceae bacterium]
MNNKSLSGSVAWYGLGNLLVRSLSFILLPLYSNLITTTEFGNYSLLLSVYAVVQVFFQFGMFGALNKFYIEEKSESKKKLIFSSVLNTIVIIALFLTLIFWHLSSRISLIIFNSTDFKNILSLTFVALFFETLGFYILTLLKTQGLAKKVVSYSASGAVLNLLLNIFFVYSLRLSVFGIILAQLVSACFLLLILLPVIKDKYIFRIDRGILNLVVKFSIPLIFANLFMAGSNVADRFILNIFSGPEQVGLYSFAYRIALIMSILIGSFSTAWNPHSLNLYYDSGYKHTFGKILNKLVAVSCLLILVVSLLAGYLFNVHIFGVSFFNPMYRSGIIIIPIVMLGYLFNGISSYYSVYPQVSNKSYHLMTSELIAFLVNVLSNIILIPRLGIIGAALS